jgi:tetratricopeptide (TPR) repeat protein
MDVAISFHLYIIMNSFELQYHPRIMSFIFGYNEDMPSPQKIRQWISPVLITIGLSMVIFLPRPLLGIWYLESAVKMESGGQFKQATSAYEEAAIRCWWQEGLYEKAAFSALNAGDDQGAILLFTQVLESGDLTDKGRMFFGDLLSKMGESKQALEIWSSISSSSEFKFNSFINRAEVETELGNFSSAIEHFRQGLILFPGNSLARYNLGVLLMAFDPSQALPEFEQVSDLPLELESKGLLLTRDLRKAIQFDDLAYQLVISGRSLAAIDEWELAYQAFRNSTTNNPLYAEAWAWMGESAQHIGKNPLPALKRSLELDPESIASLAFNGLYYRKHAKHGLAWDYYEKAARLEPGNTTWQVILGELSAEKGDLADAMEYYQQAVTISPGNPKAWRAMLDFSVYYQVHVETVALDAAIQIMKLEPGSWESYDDTGQVMMASSNFNQALYYFERSIELDPDQAESHFHLGLLLFLLDQDQDAYLELEKASLLAPGTAVAAQARDLLDQYFP